MFSTPPRRLLDMLTLVTALALAACGGADPAAPPDAKASPPPAVAPAHTELAPTQLSEDQPSAAARTLASLPAGESAPAPLQTVRLQSSSAGTSTAAASTSTTTFSPSQPSWSLCASEGGSCSFSGKRWVKYGIDTRVNIQAATGPVACTNTVFGDPAVGADKSCWVDTSATITDPVWTLCAAENGSCSYSGTRQVKYGIDTRTVIKAYTGPVACTNANFGDPAVGADKSCWVDSANLWLATSTASAPTPPPNPPASGTVSASFSPSTLDFPNPERGWYGYGAYTSSGNQGILNPSAFASDAASYYASGRRLVFSTTNLAAFVKSPISSSALADMQTSLNSARRIGMKVILRFAYNYNGNDVDATVPQMQAHMVQLKPLLYANRDILYLVQMGFIGNYGEWWHNSGKDANKTETKANKRAVRDAVLAMTPPEIPVQSTCVYCMQEDWTPTPISASTAFDGSASSRVGFHNDCYMASANDQFQFPGAVTVSDFKATQGPASQRTYVAKQSEFAPFGGETCAGSAQRLASRGGTDNAGWIGGILNEGPRYHLAFLGRDYYTAFMNTWIKEGTYSQVSRSMGYRFQLDGLSHPASAARGSAVNFTVNLRNVGWARLYSARQLRVVLSNGSNTLTGVSKEFLRQLPSQASTSSSFTVPVVLPAGAATGNWTVSIDIPDVYATTQANAFKIRPANADTSTQGWDATTFRFKTGTVLVVN